VILLYEDPPAASTATFLDELTLAAPAADAVDDRGVRHRLWTADPAAQPAAAALLWHASALPVTIADGHHRYQTAQRYCAEVGGAGSDFVLALLFEARTGGLSVLATHRLLETDSDVLARAHKAFEVVSVSAAGAAVPGGPGSIGVWTRRGGALLTPRNPDPGTLDVAVLDAAYPELVGVSQAELTQSGRISYTQDAAAAVESVESGQSDVAFLLAPTPVSAVLSVAAAGDVMPPKSTYFYPKAATGMVFNVLAA
jgi:uncharacterized protein (DUF1015 family)